MSIELTWPDAQLELSQLCEFYGITEAEAASYVKGFDMPIQTYTDAEVVAAFNSCIDLQKAAALPTAVFNRFKILMRHHRVKAVCFFPETGFGLKVHNDTQELETMYDGDEATVKARPETLGTVDLSGHWVRCPASMWTEKLTNMNAFLIMNKTGLRYYDGLGSRDNLHDGENWTSRRSSARRFKDKLEAQALAQRCEGVVVEDNPGA